MPSNIRTEYSKLLEGIAEELDIPPGKYQDAVQRYSSVGRWLEEGMYSGTDKKPYIYPHGSFRLGTVVRPIVEGLDPSYDIDLAFQLSINKESTSPSLIKMAAGDRLKENSTYQRMLDDEGRRCWTLNYAEEDGIGFHIDILPSIPEDQIVIPENNGVPPEIAVKAIAITNKDKGGQYCWLSSNPNGYADWFDNKREPIYNKTAIAQKQKIYDNNRVLFERFDDVPDPLVRTPLQRAIQILKRHRDVRFAGQDLESGKPISIIITTLSAELYRQEEDVYSALKNIIEGLSVYSILLREDAVTSHLLQELSLIQRQQDGTWYIGNPVNREENFADRWHENNHRKARAFFQWVSWVKQDLIDILDAVDIHKIGRSLENIFGEQTVKDASKVLAAAATTVAAKNSSRDIPHIEIRNPGKPWS